MKKKIGFVALDAATIHWLREKLKSAPSVVPDAPELLEALTDLEEGSSQSLMLERSENTASPATHQLVCGDLQILPVSRKVLRRGEEIPLTPKEFDILFFLARNRGEIFSKEQIYQAVWDNAYMMDDSNIMAFIRKLRKKIEPNPDAPEYILTIWGIGYKFNDRIGTEGAR